MTTSPLRRPLFRRLVAARSVVVVGNALAPLALAFAVLDLTGSPAALGAVVAARSVANVAVLLFGGVLADRFPRQLILVASSLVAATSQAAVVATLLLHVATVPVLIVFAVVNGLAAGVALPASSALVPLTVPSYLLRRANAIVRLGINGGTILGTAAGSVLIALVGPAAGIAIDAVTFTIGAALFATIRTPAAAQRDPNPSMLHELAVGWREFASRRWVWIVVAQFSIVNAAFTGAIAVLGPVIADETFGRAIWGLILAAETVGFIAGALLALRWQPHHALLVGVALVAATALPVFTLALTPVVPLLVATFFIGGLAVEQFTVAWDQSLQTNVPKDRLARIYSYDALGSFAAVPFGQALIGPIAGWLGVGTALALCGGAIVLATIAALTQPSIRQLTAT